MRESSEAGGEARVGVGGVWLLAIVGVALVRLREEAVGREWVWAAERGEKGLEAEVTRGGLEVLVERGSVGSEERLAKRPRKLESMPFETEAWDLLDSRAVEARLEGRLAPLVIST